MRVLLRNRRTHLYYLRHSPNPRLQDSNAPNLKPLDFGTVPSAAKFTLEEHLLEMEIVLRYDECDAEVALPVLPEWCLLDERAMRPVMGFA